MAQNYCLLIYTLKVMIIYHTHTHTHKEKEKAKINLHPQTQTWQKCYFKIFYNFFSDPETKISILIILECFLLLKLPPAPRVRPWGTFIDITVWSSIPLFAKPLHICCFYARLERKKVNAFIFLSHLGSYCFSGEARKHSLFLLCVSAIIPYAVQNLTISFNQAREREKWYCGIVCIILM